MVSNGDSFSCTHRCSGPGQQRRRRFLSRRWQRWRRRPKLCRQCWCLYGGDEASQIQVLKHETQACSDALIDAPQPHPTDSAVLREQSQTDMHAAHGSTATPAATPDCPARSICQCAARTFAARATSRTTLINLQLVRTERRNT